MIMIWGRILDPVQSPIGGSHGEEKGQGKERQEGEKGEGHEEKEEEVILSGTQSPTDRCVRRALSSILWESSRF